MGFYFVKGCVQNNDFRHIPLLCYANIVQNRDRIKRIVLSCAIDCLLFGNA